VIEARIYAEDPSRDFLPSSGSLGTFELPGGRGIRIDAGYRAGNRVGSWYDPMLAKLIVHGKNREDARKQMIKALNKTHIGGLSTNRDFLSGLLRSNEFRENRIHTRFIDLELKKLLESIMKRGDRPSVETLIATAGFIALFRDEESTGIKQSPWQQIGHWRIIPGITLKSDFGTHLLKYRFQKVNEAVLFRINDQESLVSLENKKGHYYRLSINGQRIKLWAIRDRSEILLDVDGLQFKFRRPDLSDRRYIPVGKKQKSNVAGEISAPLNGRVVRIHVKEGEEVSEGMSLVVIESMKMENKILADQKAIVKQIGVSEGQQVRTNQILLTLASI
jgi:acetyl/propionyl-CoA carboxylase alpha subunit